MAYTANDSPVVVAPRPVRLAHHVFFNRSPVRLMSAPADSDDLKVAICSDDKDPSDPRASPRSNLPSEALEEFLSILRPSFFPPTSPTLRSRRTGASTLPAFNYERPFSFKPRARLENMHSRNETNSDDVDASRSSQPSRNATSSTPESIDNDISEYDLYDNDGLPHRRFSSGILSSPISRMHTRNPFLRHASTQSPSPLSPLSPAAVPLPLPTPDEMMEMM